jgi:TetR/AcrR family transcriptional repressor of nem operon
MHGYITQMLMEAKDLGELPAGMDPATTAQFILNSWEGAIMHMKLVKNIEPLIIFKRMIFDHILKISQSGTEQRRT